MLVTGAAGFVGGAVYRRLMSRSVGVVGVDNFSVLPLDPPPGIVRMDVADLTVSDLAGFDSVLHCAAIKSVPASFQNPKACRDDVRAGMKLVSKCVEADMPRLVLISTCEVYGVQEGPNHAGQTPQPRSPYAIGKLELENFAKSMVRGGDGRLCITRLFNVFGPRERADAVIPALCSAVAHGKPFAIEGSGEQRRDLTYIDDCVDELLPLLTSRQESHCIGSGVSWSVIDLVNIMRRLGEPVEVIHLPERPREIPEFRFARDAPRDFDMAQRILETLQWWRKYANI